MCIELAVSKATTVTKAKCHSRWQLYAFPRIAFYEARTVTKDFSKCHEVVDGATSWNNIYHSNRSKFSGRNSFPGISIYESNLTKANLEIFFVYRSISINTE